MAFVITQKCAGTCDAACVEVCPVDCIHGPVEIDLLRSLSPEARAKAVFRVQLYIDPLECIDCGACAPECPVDAIYGDDAVPPEHHGDIAANAQFFIKLRGPGY
jgi:ferredoxin